MAEWNRIVAECEGYPILIEGFIEDTALLKTGMLYLGYQGPIEEAAPFILRPDGQLDYGSGWEDYRYAMTTVFKTPMRVGDSFTITEYDEESEEWSANTYQIAKIDKV